MSISDRSGGYVDHETGEWHEFYDHVTQSRRHDLPVRRDPGMAAYGFRELIRRVWPKLDRRDIERAASYYADEYGRFL